MADQDLNFRITAQDEASKTLDSVETKGEKLEKGFQVPVEVETTNIEARINHIHEVIAGLSAEDKAIVLQANITEFEQQIALAKRELTDLSLTPVEIQVRVQEIQTGTQQVASLKQELAGTGAALTEAEGATISTTSALGRMSSVASGAGIALGGISDSAISSTAALALMDPELGAVAAAVVVATLAFQAFTANSKDAAAAAAEGKKAADDWASSLDKIKSASDITGVSGPADFVTALGESFVKTDDKAGEFLLTLQNLFGTFDDFGTKLADLETKTDRAEFFKNFLATSDQVVGGNAQIAASVGPMIQQYDNFDAIMARAQGTHNQATVDFLNNNKAAIDSLFGLKDAAQSIDISSFVTQSKDDILKAKDGVLLWVEALKELKAEGIVNPSDEQILGRTIQLYSDAAEASKRWEDANRKLDTSIHPELWQQAADGAHNLTQGIALTAGQTDAVNTLMKDFGVTSDQVLTAGIGLWNDNAKAATEAAKAAEKAAEDESTSMQKLGDDLDSIEEKFGTVTAVAKEFADTTAAIGDAAFAVHEAAGKDNTAIGDFGDTIKKLLPDMKKEGKTFGDLTGHLDSQTEAGEKAIEATHTLAKSVRDDLTQAYINSGGSIEATQKRAEELRAEISKKLTVAGVDKSEIDNYFEFLRLNPPQVEVDVKAAEKTDATNLLKQIVSDLNDDLKNNPALKLQIDAAINAKDPITGLGELINAYKANPVVLPALLNLLAGLPTDLKQQLDQWLKDHGINVTIPATPVLGPLPQGTVATTADGKPVVTVVEPALGNLPEGTQVDPPPGVNVLLPTQLQPPDPWGDVEKRAIEVANGINVPVSFEAPTPADAAAMVAAGFEGNAPSVPVGINPSVNQQAKQISESDLDGLKTDPKTGADRSANINVQVSGLDTEGKKVDTFVDKDRTIHIKVQVDPIPDPLAVGADDPTRPGRHAAGTAAPTTIQVRQTINAGFGTDRFALERAVRKANRHTERLAGIRR